MTTVIKKYPIGIQSFEKLRQENYIYIDKTSLIYDIVSHGSYYFLSRPRRFGKSLLLSTLEAYFLGKKELFKGLDIEHLESDWPCHPVLHLDLNTEKYDSPQALYAVLERNLSEWEKLYGNETYETTFGGRFEGIIKRAALKTGRGVVILVDEYDKPMLQAIDDDALQQEFRNTLKGFYGAVKSMDKYIRFAFFTGVTKFGKVSVFSDLNSLNDISMWERYVDICGVSEQELREQLHDDIKALAAELRITEDECYAKLKKNYDGYHFCPNSIGTYNPFSLLNTLDRKRFGDYWFETGTPTFLVELLKKTNYNLNNLTRERVTGDVINSIDSMEDNPIPVIYQAGYLTIQGYDERFRKYLLGFPNQEVENGFINFLAPAYTGMKPARTEFYIENFIEDVETGQAERFMKRLQAMLCDTDNKIVGDAELYFQNATYVFFKMMGFYVEVERPTSDGRMDMIIKTSKFIYILEFKLDGTASEALRQIEEKEYARPFALDNRKLYKIGINFSTKTRSVKEWKVV
ncbi:MAG: ATP-binding protein [Prevotella sp.]|nr:ATP-binding protein [Prevotella sp.]